MPVRAVWNGDDIHGFDFDNDQWSELKRKYKENNLIMPCCSSKGIPKTSKLGNHYFAHACKNGCAYESESQEHMYLKSIVAKAARKCGWETWTERSGESIDGDKWIADVYCVKGKAKVVIEIQLSRQSLGETIQRQSKYKRSGVRCAWIASDYVFKNDFIEDNKITPFFLVSRESIDNTPRMSEFKITVENFIKSLLSGYVVWKENIDKYEILYADDICWNCGKKIKQIYGFEIDVYGDHAKTRHNASKVLHHLSSIIDNDTLRQHGLNYIGEFNGIEGNAPYAPYCNACLHCGSPQNNEHLMTITKFIHDDKHISCYVVGTTGKWVMTDS